MKIIHAVCDEHSSSHGGERGDQTGREIREQKWYIRDGGWEQVIMPTNRTRGEKAVTFAKAFCAGNYGYNQSDRWSGREAALESGIENGCGDFDCSSLCLTCYDPRFAGCDIPEEGGSTRDIAEILCKTGEFVLYTDEEHLTNPELACKGTLFCTPQKHVCMCIEDGDEYEQPEEKTSEYGSIRVKGNNVRVRTEPITGSRVTTLHAGDTAVIEGIDETTGWYRIPQGYITNKERYVEKI